MANKCYACIHNEITNAPSLKSALQTYGFKG
jgi:hypothetical protein